MSRRIVQDAETGKPVSRQHGYVYQKGRKKGDLWSPKERAYGRYRIDVPGEHGQKEIRVALGYCRCEMDAMLRLQKEMEKAGVLDLDKVRERLSPIVTFRTHAAWWLEAITSGEVVHSKKRTSDYCQHDRVLLDGDCISERTDWRDAPGFHRQPGS